MCEKLNKSLIKCGNINNSVLYKLKNDGNIYLISNEGTRKLLCEPEIIGYNIPELLKSPIIDILSWFGDDIISANVLNILRGGLNFPIEEACFISNVDVKGISFITSERLFLDKKVSRIETSYRKIQPIPNASIIIGDIIASGETIKNAIRFVEETYALAEVALKNIIILTIGTKNILPFIKDFEIQLKKRWATFEKISVCFFEGIFNVYSNTGITGLNLPRVDFCINNAIITPEFRKTFIEKETPVFEKCVIYDGGARRFEQLDHIVQLVNYWESLNSKIDAIKNEDFVEEKFGYTSDIKYEEWKIRNGYSELTNDTMIQLYDCEIALLQKLEKSSLNEYTISRYSRLQNIFANR